MVNEETRNVEIMFCVVSLLIGIVILMLIFIDTAEEKGFNSAVIVENQEVNNYYLEPTFKDSYICSYNAYNCDDFETHLEAQEIYGLCGGLSNDVHHLDGDSDGSACEVLP